MEGCLGCEGISERPVELLDGRVVCNECPDWRMECEARYLLRTLKGDKKIRDALQARRNAGRGDVGELRKVMLKMRGYEI
jgi:hypothetical protein